MHIQCILYFAWRVSLSLVRCKCLSAKSSCYHKHTCQLKHQFVQQNYVFEFAPSWWCNAYSLIPKQMLQLIKFPQTKPHSKHGDFWRRKQIIAPFAWLVIKPSNGGKLCIYPSTELMNKWDTCTLLEYLFFSVIIGFF